MSTDPTERLRVDVPTLEPDPVLLSRLVAASATASTPSRAALPRVLLAAASVAAIAVTAWGISHLPDGGPPPPSPVQSPGRGLVTPTPPSDHSEGTTPEPGASTDPDAHAPTSPASGSTPGDGPSLSAGTVPGGSGPTPSRAGAPDSAATSREHGEGAEPGRGRSGDTPGKHRGQRKPKAHLHDGNHAVANKRSTTQSRMQDHAQSPRRVATGQELSQKNTS